MAEKHFDTYYEKDHNTIAEENIGDIQFEVEIKNQN